MNIVTWWKKVGLRSPQRIVWNLATYPFFLLGIGVVFTTTLVHTLNLDDAKNAAKECWYI